MIRIDTFRRGLVCVAVNINDFGQVEEVALGLTCEAASRRLVRKVTR